MFKLIGWIIKATLFACIVLVASHFVTWNGKSVSDQVRSTISSAERSPTVKAAKKSSAGFIEGARSAAEKALRSEPKKRAHQEAPTSDKRDEIPMEDKVELQSLIEVEQNQT